jgi:hypothetical protein
MKRIIIVMLLVLSFSVTCFAGAEEAQSLEKAFSQVKLKAEPPLSILYLPKVVDNGYTRYEGQIGKLSLAVFVRPSDKTVARVYVTTPGIQQDLLPSVINEFGKPSDVSDSVGYKTYKGTGDGYYWDMVLKSANQWGPAQTSVFYANSDEKI